MNGVLAILNKIALYFILFVTHSGSKLVNEVISHSAVLLSSMLQHLNVTTDNASLLQHSRSHTKIDPNAGLVARWTPRDLFITYVANFFK